MNILTIEDIIDGCPSSKAYCERDDYYSHEEVRWMIICASVQAYKKGAFNTFREDAPISVDEFLKEIEQRKFNASEKKLIEQCKKFIIDLDLNN